MVARNVKADGPDPIHNGMIITNAIFALRPYHLSFVFSAISGVALLFYVRVLARSLIVVSILGSPIKSYWVRAEA